MTLDLDKIESDARTAQDIQPGRYYTVRVRFMQHEVRCVDDEDSGETEEVALCRHAVTAQHIANCSPDVVLELVHRIRVMWPVYLAAKGIHQLTDLFGAGDEPHMSLHPKVRQLVEALEASYGKL